MKAFIACSQRLLRKIFDTGRCRIYMNPSDQSLYNLPPKSLPLLNAKLCQYVFEWVSVKWVWISFNFVNFIKCTIELFLKLKYSRLPNKPLPASCFIRAFLPILFPILSSPKCLLGHYPPLNSFGLLIARRHWK